MNKLVTEFGLHRPSSGRSWWLREGLRTGLCLSGGGGKGAFQIGVLEYLAEHPELFPEGFFCGSGTSVGAVNIAGLAMEPAGSGQIAAYTEFAIRYWECLTRTEDVWRYWKLWYVSALWKLSIGDNSPLRKLLLKLVDLDRVMAGPPCSVVAFDLLAGRGKAWDLKEANSTEELVSFLLASSSFPIAFPPEPIGAGLYTDGGIVDIAPTRPVIDHGVDHILAILCRNPEVPEPWPREKFSNAGIVGLRCIDEMENEILRGDLEQVRLHSQLAEAGLSPKKRPIDLTVIMPHEPLGDGLDFSASETRRRRKIGYEAARRTFTAEAP